MKHSAFRLGLLTLLVVGMTATVSAQSPQPQQYFNLDGSCDPQDQSGNGNDGICKNSPTTGVTGQYGDAYNFDLSNDEYIDLDGGNDGSLSELTVFMWINPDQDGSSGTWDPWGARNSNDGDADNWLQHGGFATEGLRFGLQNDAGTREFVDSSSGVVSKNSWTCVAGRWDGSNVELVKADSPSDSVSQVASGSLSGSIDVTGNKQWIGDRPASGTPSNSYSGSIDNYAFYTEYLTDSEFSNLCDSANLVNSAPTFDSVSTSPSSWTLGSDIDVSADVSDSDGTVSSVEADVWENGTQIVSDQALSKSSGTWEVDNLFTVDESDVYYNLTLTATDDDGATSTFEEDRFISDNPPSISLNDPGNESLFDYDVPVSFDVSDSDDVNDELYQCTGEFDNKMLFDETLLENDTSSYSDTFRADLGQHKFNVICSDDAGNTATKTENFTVKALNFSNLQGPSNTVETINESYTADLKVGDMLENLTTTLNYENSKVKKANISSSAIQSFTEKLYYETPIVQNNASTKNWSLRFDYDIQDFNSGTDSLNKTSQNQSQTVNHGFYIQSSETNPSDGDYIEDENYQHEINVYTKTKKPFISAVNTYNRTNNTVDAVLSMEGSDSNIYTGSQDVGLADSFNKSTFGTSSEFTVQFKNSSRTFSTATEPINVHKIILTDGTSSLDTSKALQFNTYYEGTEDLYHTDLNMDLTVFNEEGEKSRRYSFQETDSKQHDFYVYPKWADYFVQTQEYPNTAEFDIIQYEPSTEGGNLRSYFFPKPEPIDDTVTEVPLQTINDSETSRIDYEVTTSSGAEAEGIVCRADRKFSGTGEHKTVYMIRTGAQGNSQSFAEVNEIYYRHICFDGEEQVDTFGDQIISNPMRFTLGEGEEDTQLDYYKKFDASCTVNETQIDCSYQSQTEELERAELIVDRKEVVSDVRIANKTSSSATGGLTVNGINTTNSTYRYQVTGYYPNGIAPVIDTTTSQQIERYGAAGIFATMVIFLFVFAASSFNPLIGVMTGTVALLLSNLVDFILLTPAQRATLIALVIVIAVVINE